MRPWLNTFGPCFRLTSAKSPSDPGTPCCPLHFSGLYRVTVSRIWSWYLLLGLLVCSFGFRLLPWSLTGLDFSHLSGDFLQSFRARLSSGSKSPPISDSDLKPFLEDLRSFMKLSSSDFDLLRRVPAGQPFRLFLLDALLAFFNDPDRSFVDLLVDGVPLGVDSDMPSCPTLFPPTPQAPPSMDLTHCSSSWGSALSDQASVDALLSEEVSEDWVRAVRGGLPELQSQYSQTAVGKLGLVKSPGRPDRLVVDSSVSGVTEHTALPNKSANPSISGVRECFPPEHALECLLALILDVSKAHRRIKIRPSDRGLLCAFTPWSLPNWIAFVTYFARSDPPVRFRSTYSAS